MKAYLYFSMLIASPDSCPMVLFQVTVALLNKGGSESLLLGHVKEPFQPLSDKIIQINLEVDAGLVAGLKEILGAESCQLSGNDLNLDLRKWTESLRLRSQPLAP